MADPADKRDYSEIVREVEAEVERLRALGWARKDFVSALVQLMLPAGYCSVCYGRFDGDPGTTYCGSEHTPTTEEQMKLYIAGASSEIVRCEAFRDAAVKLGYKLTADWMVMIRETGKANTGLTDEQRRAAEALAIAGVTECELFVLLLPGTRENDYRGNAPVQLHTIGAWYELAVAKNSKKVLLVGTEPERTVFTVDLERIETDAEALMWMRGRLAAIGLAMA